jgi:hypothetical protein
MSYLKLDRNAILYDYRGTVEAHLSLFDPQPTIDPTSSLEMNFYFF